MAQDRACPGAARGAAAPPPSRGPRVDELAARGGVDDAGHQVALAVAGGAPGDLLALLGDVPGGVADLDERAVLALDVDVLAVHEHAGDPAALLDARALHRQVAASLRP
jgi:hypothetical protein